MIHLETSTQCQEISKQHPSKIDVRITRGISKGHKHDYQKVDFENAEVIQIVPNGFIYKNEGTPDF